MWDTLYYIIEILGTLRPTPCSQLGFQIFGQILDLSQIFSDIFILSTWICSISIEVAEVPGLEVVLYMAHLMVRLSSNQMIIHFELQIAALYVQMLFVCLIC